MQKSPFDAVHQQLGASYGTYDGWSLPSDFGDPHGEFNALSESCAVVDLSSFGRIQVSGSTAKETIHRVFSIEKGGCAPESWTWARPDDSDPERICRIVRLNGGYTLLTKHAQAEAICNTLTTVADDGVTVADLTDKTAMLGLYGPKAFESVRGVLPFDIDYLERGDAAKVSFLMMNFTLLRGSWLNGDGLELICPAAAAPLTAGAIAKYRHKHNITPAGMTCLQEAMNKTQKPI